MKCGLFKWALSVFVFLGWGGGKKLFGQCLIAHIHGPLLKKGLPLTARGGRGKLDEVALRQVSSVDNSLVFEESNQLSARTEIVDKLFASDFLCRISSGGQMVMRSTERGGRWKGECCDQPTGTQGQKQRKCEDKENS